MIYFSLFFIIIFLLPLPRILPLARARRARPEPSFPPNPFRRPDNWGAVDEAFQREFIQSRIAAAAELGKPMLLEEWGKWVNESADATLADRSAFMKIVYEEVEAAMADPASPLQGSAFWQARPPFF